jgi:hypothetical protein
VRQDAFRYDRLQEISIAEGRVIHTVFKVTHDNAATIHLNRTSYILLQILQLISVAHRTQCGGGVHRVTNHSLLPHNFEQAIPELIVDTLLYDESFRVEPCLGVHMQSTFVSAISSVLEVSAFQHKERVVTTKLIRSFLHVEAGLRCNFHPSRGTTSEFDSLNTFVRDDLAHLVVGRKNVCKL